jgi:prepilin-type N-terminal cleavage/methylation domain-containing protein
MHTLRARQGYTLIELMTVMAIVGVITAWGIASLRSYARHEDTRRAATAVAAAFAEARSEAVAGGKMTWIVIGEPTDGSIAFDTGQYAALVVDADGDGAISGGDTIRPLYMPSGLGADISTYGAHGLNGLKTTALPPQDESQAVTTGNLTALVDGTTIPVDAAKGVPVLAFSPQGAPVNTATPALWGSGAGGMYLTDNDQMLIAVVVQPVGEVRTFAWDAGSGTWK